MTTKQYSCRFCSVQEKEKELDLQRSMNQELDMALRLLEKDIHEKQDTVIQLRKQLDDIKTINLEMYNKLQVILSFLILRCHKRDCVFG